MYLYTHTDPSGYYEVKSFIVSPSTVLTIESPLTFRLSPCDNPRRFIHWRVMEGSSVHIEDQFSTRTTLSNFESDCEIVAKYGESEYQLDVRSKNGQGENIHRTYKVPEGCSSVSISTPGSIEYKDYYGRVVAVLVFQKWNVYGEADLDIHSSRTNVTNFNSDVSVEAVYIQEGVTIPQPTPTPMPTSTPTPTPTPIPIPTPPPTPAYYTLTVRVMNSEGKYYTSDVYNNITGDSIQSISAPSSVTVGDPAYPQSLQTLYFHDWSISGTGTISNVNSTSTSVKNIGSNVTVTANYRN